MKNVRIFDISRVTTPCHCVPRTTCPLGGDWGICAGFFGSETGEPPLREKRHSSIRRNPLGRAELGRSRPSRVWHALIIPAVRAVWGRSTRLFPCRYKRLRNHGVELESVYGRVTHIGGTRPCSFSAES